MKRARIFLLMIFSILLTGRGWAQTKEELVVPLSEPGKPFKLTAHVLHGSIKVSSYEGKDVIIDVFADSTRKRKEEADAPGGLKRIGGGSGLDITAQENNNAITINGGLSHLSGITIKIPQSQTTLTLGAVNQGDITVSNVTGALEINNVNGAIKLTGIAGSVVANTVNGPVVVTFRSVDQKAPMAFSTLNGNVDITFPGEIKSNVKLKSDRGGVFTDFDIAVDKSAPKVNKKEENHMYRINIDEWVYGTINGGGPEMMMKTMTGDIYIRKAK